MVILHVRLVPSCWSHQDKAKKVDFIIFDTYVIWYVIFGAHIEYRPMWYTYKVYGSGKYTFLSWWVDRHKWHKKIS